MSEPNFLSILHVSDLHFSKRKSREIEIIVKALLDDVRKICIGYRKPDVIIFSGDLVQNSDEDNPDEAFDAFIGPLLAASGCSEERVIICPGNHDASRLVISANSDLHRKIRDALKSGDEANFLNQEYSGQELNDVLNKKFERNSELSRFLNDGSGRTEVFRSEFGSIEHIPALNLQVICLNSAAFSTAGMGGFESDNGRLAIPEYALLDIENMLIPKISTISVMHHPFQMMTESSAKLIETFISKH